MDRTLIESVFSHNSIVTFSLSLNHLFICWNASVNTAIHKLREKRVNDIQIALKMEIFFLIS